MQRLIETFVRPTLAGELIGSLAITEPGGGSDVGHLRTTAVRDGDHYIVNGAKTYITSGVRADYVVTAVRTGGPGAAGFRCWWSRRARLDFEVTRKLDKMGWRSSDTAELSYVDARRSGGQPGRRREQRLRARSRRHSSLNASPLPHRHIRAPSDVWTSPCSGAATGRRSAGR